MLCVDTFVRGLCSDINKLDVARTNKDQIVVKETEEIVSKGNQSLKLSKIYRQSPIFTSSHGGLVR